ncbi:MAG TPA: hypothetical protein VEW03_02830, partial [Longimicrobiaceae bacterium]|nr:hypothetical protein [Longimicrobiaceae bacterium]
RAGKEFIRRQVEAEVREGIAALQHPALQTAAGLLALRYRSEIAALRQRLEQRVPETTAAVVVRMQDADCECRRELATLVRSAFDDRIASLSQGEARLVALAHGEYVEVVRKVLRDLRIFMGANAAVFLFLLIASFLKPGAVAQLFLPAILLVVATLVSGYFYLFRQSWFSTIVHDDYVGYGYIAYVLLVFLLLCDVVVNRARVTTKLVNAALNAVGSAVSLAPC